MSRKAAKTPPSSRAADDDMDFTQVKKPRRDFTAGIRSNIVPLKDIPGFGLQVKAPNIEHEEAGVKLQHSIQDKLFVGTATYQRGISAQDSTWGRAKEPCVQIQVFSPKLMREAVDICAALLEQEMAPTSGDWHVKTLTAELEMAGDALTVTAPALLFLDLWFHSFKAVKPDLAPERLNPHTFKFTCNGDDALKAWTHRQIVKLAERVGIELEDKSGCFINRFRDSILRADAFLRSMEPFLTPNMLTPLPGSEPSNGYGATTPRGALALANRCENFDKQTQTLTKTCLCRDERGRRCTVHSWLDSVQIMSMLPPSFYRS